MKDKETRYNQLCQHIIGGARLYFNTLKDNEKNLERFFSSELLLYQNKPIAETNFNWNFSITDSILNKLTQKKYDSEKDLYLLVEELLYLMHLGSLRSYLAVGFSQERYNTFKNLLASAAATTAITTEEKYEKIDVCEQPVISNSNKAIAQEPTNIPFNGSPLDTQAQHRALVKRGSLQADKKYSDWSYRSASIVNLNIKNEDERNRKVLSALTSKIDLATTEYQNNNLGIPLNNKEYKPPLLFKSHYAEYGQFAGKLFSFITGKKDENTIAREEEKAIHHLTNNSSHFFDIFYSRHSFLLLGWFRFSSNYHLVKQTREKLLNKVDEFLKSYAETNNSLFHESDEFKKCLFAAKSGIDSMQFIALLNKLKANLDDNIKNHVLNLLNSLNEYSKLYNKKHYLPRIYNEDHYLLSSFESQLVFLLGGTTHVQCKSGRNRSVVASFSDTVVKELMAINNDNILPFHTKKYAEELVNHLKNDPARDYLNHILPGTGGSFANLKNILPNIVKDELNKEYMEEQDKFASLARVEEYRPPTTDLQHQAAKHIQELIKKTLTETENQKENSPSNAPNETPTPQPTFALVKIPPKEKTPNEKTTFLSDFRREIIQLIEPLTRNITLIQAFFKGFSYIFFKTPMIIILKGAASNVASQIRADAIKQQHYLRATTSFAKHIENEHHRLHENEQNNSLLPCRNSVIYSENSTTTIRPTLGS